MDKKETHRKRKREPNSWLIDQEFLMKSDFFDLYYFQTLTRCLWNYLINVPVPVLSTWDKTNKRIYLSIGEHKKHFPVDINIFYDDFIVLVDRWLRQLYPQYEITYKKLVSYTDEEILRIVEEQNINLNDAILMEKEVDHIEYGIIEKLFMMEDQFIIKVDNRRFLRMSGTIDNVKPLKVFLKELRLIEDQYNIKEYIFRNSVQIEEIFDKNKVIELQHIGQMLFNFVKINYQDLKEYEFIKKENRNWTWGNYAFKIDSDILETDILNFLKEQGFDKVKK